MIGTVFGFDELAGILFRSLIWSRCLLSVGMPPVVMEVVFEKSAIVSAPWVVTAPHATKEFLELELHSWLLELAELGGVGLSIG